MKRGRTAEFPTGGEWSFLRREKKLSIWTSVAQEILVRHSTVSTDSDLFKGLKLWL